MHLQVYRQVQGSIKWCHSAWQENQSKHLAICSIPACLGFSLTAWYWTWFNKSTYQMHNKLIRFLSIMQDNTTSTQEWTAKVVCLTLQVVHPDSIGAGPRLCQWGPKLHRWGGPSSMGGGPKLHRWGAKAMRVGGPSSMGGDPSSMGGGPKFHRWGTQAL